MSPTEPTEPFKGINESLRRKSMTTIGIVMLAVPTVIASVALVFPSAFNWMMPGCSFHKLTGMHCVGCGGTRMANSLLHGQVIKAFQHNAFLFCMIPLYLGMAAHYLIYGRTGKKLWPWPVRWYTWAILGVIAVAFWIVRNLPFPFGQALAP